LIARSHRDLRDIGSLWRLVIGVLLWRAHGQRQRVPRLDLGPLRRVHFRPELPAGVEAPALQPGLLPRGVPPRLRRTARAGLWCARGQRCAVRERERVRVAVADEPLAARRHVHDALALGLPHARGLARHAAAVGPATASAAWWGGGDEVAMCNIWGGGGANPGVGELKGGQKIK
jgi:hypothetical protein